MKRKNKNQLKRRTLIRKVIGVALVVFGALLIFNIIIPMLIGIASMFISLINLFQYIGPNFKFLGGCFFLVVYWYVVTHLFNMCIKIIKKGHRTFIKKEKLTRRKND